MVIVNNENENEVFGKAGEVLHTICFVQDYNSKPSQLFYISGTEETDALIGDAVDFHSKGFTIWLAAYANAFGFIISNGGDTITNFMIFRDEIENFEVLDNQEITVVTFNSFIKSMKKGLGGGGALGVLLTSAMGHLGDKVIPPKTKKIEGVIYKFNFLNNGKLSTLVLSSKSEFLTEINYFLFKYYTKELHDAFKKPVKEGCYIATACYGSYESKELIVFRKFRDNKLKKSILGLLFIKIYYSISPLLVRFLFKKKSFNLFVRKYFLDKIYFFLKNLV